MYLSPDDDTNMKGEWTSIYVGSKGSVVSITSTMRIVPLKHNCGISEGHYGWTLHHVD